jgi:hypothetical protein
MLLPVYARCVARLEDVWIAPWTPPSGHRTASQIAHPRIAPERDAARATTAEARYRTGVREERK